MVMEHSLGAVAAAVLVLGYATMLTVLLGADDQGEVARDSEMFTVNVLVGG